MDLPWHGFYKTITIRAIISEIQQQTDRGVMIIGASLLEGRLMQSIQLRMMPDMPTDMGVYRTRFLGHKFVSCGGPE